MWLRTLRVHVIARSSESSDVSVPWILTFFHGNQFGLLAWHRRRPTVAMVSLSRDGDLQVPVLRWQGLKVVRGSSSRAGAQGLAQLVSWLRQGNHDVAVAVDGPKGPRECVHPGSAWAARATGSTLVPLACASAPHFTFRRAWDQFELPYPFARVVIVLGEPITPSPTTDETSCRIQQAVRQVRARAQAHLASTAP